FYFETLSAVLLPPAGWGGMDTGLLGISPFKIYMQIKYCVEKTLTAKGKGKFMVKEELKGPEVCKDPVRLTTYAVGVNVFKQGEDPMLKPPDQYPEWLFQLNLGAVKKLHELDADTWEYWKRLRKENMWRFNRLHKGKKF
uniref:Large ribosomal subunit protein mL54 n=1 Tax=Takifugu rubripes TaxID=31033 RepID=A0A674N427_TAKRU